MTSSTIKRLGALFVVVVAPLLHVAVPGAFWGRTSAAIAAGLMMIFFSHEANHDEPRHSTLVPLPCTFG